MIICLASIGLVSQIYHTGGKLYQALLLWSVITTGVAAAAKKSLIPFFWISGFLSGLTFTAIDSPVFQPIFHKNGIPVFMTIPLLSSLLALICRRMAGECSQTKAFRSWTVISGMIALIIAESQVWNNKSHTLGITAFMPGYGILALLAIGIWMNHHYKVAQKVLLLATLSFYLVPFHFQLFALRSDVAYAFFTLAVFVSMAVFLASLKLRSLFQFFLVAIGIRFLILYFQSLGGLATTGFGLIISGIMIIFVVVVWNKYLKQITTWAGGLIE